MEGCDLEDFGYLAGVLFTTLTPVLGFVAVWLALALGPPAILATVTAVLAYGLLTEIHVRRRVEAAFPYPPATRRPRRHRLVDLAPRARLLLSVVGGVHWSGASEDGEGSFSAPELTGSFALRLYCGLEIQREPMQIETDVVQPMARRLTVNGAQGPLP